MKVLVIGSGLIGLTTAYFLKDRGHEVTVVDREQGSGRATSFANGALLTPGMSDPWNAPGCWRALLASIGRSDSAVQVRLRALPSLLGWGVAFLRNSRLPAFEHNTLSNLQLGLYSLGVLDSLRQRTGIEYGRAARGSLKIFRDQASLDRASAADARVACAGMLSQRLSRDQVVALEPALSPVAQQLEGAIHYQTDETGDAYRFCVALTSQAQVLGVKFRFGTEVTSLNVSSGRIKAALARGERFTADRYVVAAGSYSTALLRGVGIRLPVRPAKGYSVTFDDSPGPLSLSIPVIDDHLHAAVVPLQGALRAVGTAEFAGFDLSVHPDRVRNIVNFAQGILPRARLDPASAIAWCGLRPMSSDGVPIVGSTPISNLWVNTGHGHLGWTMAAGSAQLLADLMCGGTPAIDSTRFALSRFG